MAAITKTLFSSRHGYLNITSKIVVRSLRSWSGNRSSGNADWASEKRAERRGGDGYNNNRSSSINNNRRSRRNQAWEPIENDAEPQEPARKPSWVRENATAAVADPDPQQQQDDGTTAAEEDWLNSTIKPRPGALPSAKDWPRPWVQLKSWSFHPTIYPAMIRGASPDAKPGDLVAIYSKDGRRFGAGLYNPQARVPLRVFHHGDEAVSEEYFIELIQRAIDLRTKILRLQDHSDAFRVIHSDADGLSGLVVDKYADTLSVEVHSLGVWQRLHASWMSVLHQQLGTKNEVVHVDPWIAQVEGIDTSAAATTTTTDSDAAAAVTTTTTTSAASMGKGKGKGKKVKIKEHGMLYEVDFEAGHKTGFFCDQRENRLKLSQLARGQTVLDLCCYTGGFSIAAALGGATKVIGVDLDEKAIAQARRNVNINNLAKIVKLVHCDAFSYARQMKTNNERFGVVILDPPKFIGSREEESEGRRKYEDLNGLGVSLVEPGGLLVTCSCSGQLTQDDFEEIVTRAAHRQNRKLQFLDRTGAGMDHPVMSNCPESRYLKVLWARVL